ncbi:hypothetical protein JAAARDRAFT_311876 [Jaapia argillacea MUCL 33604]|uniref:Uncharacterized protein n=1 Tax=Jaapia argillacea MUCL 33604 TaxID=933084 RepID=A0A067PNR8_9AGAM|nr:hypothetical protein JAAARDRAFT_311876 [Jaapia argillacea MUCL 33604]
MWRQLVISTDPVIRWSLSRLIPGLYRSVCMTSHTYLWDLVNDRPMHSEFQQLRSLWKSLVQFRLIYPDIFDRVPPPVLAAVCKYLGCSIVHFPALIPRSQLVDLKKLAEGVTQESRESLDALLRDPVLSMPFYVASTLFNLSIDFHKEQVFVLQGAQCGYPIQRATPPSTRRGLCSQLVNLVLHSAYIFAALTTICSRRPQWIDMASKLEIRPLLQQYTQSSDRSIRSRAQTLDSICLVRRDGLEWACNGVALRVGPTQADGSCEIEASFDHYRWPYPPCRQHVEGCQYLFLVDRLHSDLAVLWVPLSDMFKDPLCEHRPITIPRGPWATTAMHVGRYRTGNHDKGRLVLLSADLRPLSPVAGGLGQPKKLHVLAIRKEKVPYNPGAPDPEVYWMTEEHLVHAVTLRTSSNKFDPIRLYRTCNCDRGKKLWRSMSR